MEAVKIDAWSDIRELVLMSIGTDKGSWWADPTFGSDLWKLRQSGKVTGETAGTVKRIVLESLQWLVDDGLTTRISCEAEQTGKNEISYSVTILQPDGKTEQVQEVWNAIR